MGKFLAHLSVYIKTIIPVIILVGLDYGLTQLPVKVSIPNDIAEIFFGSLGMVYAIIIGFAIYEVLNNYSEIKRCMNCEINELQDLRDFLMYIGHNQQEIKDDIRRKTKLYAKHVIDHEWPQMCAHKDVDVDTPYHIYQMIEGINGITITETKDALAFDKLVSTVGNMTTYRTNRITASMEKLPTLLMQLIWILSFFVVITFTLLDITPLPLSLALTFLNSFGIIFIYFVIKDLDYPFGGAWSIEPKPFQHFLDKTT